MKWGRVRLLAFVVAALQLSWVVAADAQASASNRPSRLSAASGPAAPVSLPPEPRGEEIPPTFSKTFVPDTIGPGSVTTLRFEIVNQDSLPVSELAFVDNLPAGVTIAGAPGLSNGCNGTLTAPAGASTITYTDGTLAAGQGQSCSISVNVTSGTPGTHMNVSGDLTSDRGNSGAAIDDLTVATDRPGFSKSFAPASIPLGDRSTLTLTIDNTANPSLLFAMSFVDNLPVGLVVAGPADASTDCEAFGPATLTATPGSSVIALSQGSVAASSFCTVIVDVVATGFGTLENTTGDLIGQVAVTQLNSGKAAAILEVTVTPLALAKAFTDDPVPSGGTVTLAFSISNFSRDDSATAISFTDDLDATLSGLVATGLPLADPCGAGSALSGTSLLTLTGGNLPPEGSCLFTVSLSVPAAAPSGAFPNTTSTVTATIGGVGSTGNAASDLLFVEPAPVLTKSFTDDPVGAGGSTVLEFSLTNTSLSFDATAIAFDDVFDIILPSASATPGNDCCGSGSICAFTPLINPPGSDGTPARLSISNATLPAGGSCTFEITLDVAVGVAAGTYPNTTTVVTATVDGETVTGNPANDDLVVVGAPTLIKEFTDDPVDPGATVTLEFTIAHDEIAGGDATAIAFTDDLAATLSGLSAIGLPINDVCGPGSQLSGTTLLTFTGGTLAPAESCTFSVTLQVPAGAAAGLHTNTTSDLTATVLGVAVTGNPASDDLRIAGLQLTKEFTDDPVLPGATVDLQFTIENVSATDDATAILFQDDLDGTLNNLAATGLPLNDICGSGSILTGSAGNTFLTFSNGSLAAGKTCAFTVTLNVPAAADSDTYVNTTQSFQATIGGVGVPFDNATDELVVDSNLLLFTKEFTDDPVPPGDTVTLEFSITNQDATEAIGGIAFTDDLDATLSGLVATGLPMNDVCGPGSVVSGTSLLTLTGGILAPATTCVFSVTLTVPSSVPIGTTAFNTTSVVTGTIGAPVRPGGSRVSLGGGLPVTGDPATDELFVSFLDFSKSFANPAFAGLTTTLTFTIENLSASSTVSDLAFSDNLDAVLSGLSAVGLPAGDVCGVGSQIAGTTLLTFSGGNLLPGGSCTFFVSVTVPASAPAGTFTNTTSDLTQVGLTVSPPAVDDLIIEPAPIFGKIFAPDSVDVGVPSTLTFTIDNNASAVAATNLDFTDNLPAGLVVHTIANASTTCTGGTVTAVAGTSVIAYTGGTVGAATACTVQADVSSVLDGVFVNVSGDLTSSSGNSGTATDTLTITRTVDVSVTKTDGVTEATPGLSLTYTLVVANAGPGVDPAVGFVDMFPSQLICAYTSAAAGGATGNTAAGSGDLAETLSMPAGSSVTYTANCDIDPAATGTLSNTATATASGTDTDPSNDSATDDDTELAPEADLLIELTVVYDPAVAKTVQVYDLKITNAGPSTATDILVEQELPVGTNFIGVRPSGLACFDGGIAVSCEIATLDPDEMESFSVGAHIDPRFDGVLSTEALVSAATADPDDSDNEQDADTTVARPRSMIASNRADGTEILVMVAKESDETIGLVFAEAAGGGSRDYSVTSPGFRTVAITEVSDFGGSTAPEVAALGFGFDGTVLVDVVDVDTTALLASHPIPGDLIPVDIVSISDLPDGITRPSMTGVSGPELEGSPGVPLGGDTSAPELAILVLDEALPGVCVIVVDAASGSELRRICSSGQRRPERLGGLGLAAEFPIGLARVDDLRGGPELLGFVTSSLDETIVYTANTEFGFIELSTALPDGAFPIAIAGLEDVYTPLGGQNGAELAILTRQVETGTGVAELVDSLAGFLYTPVVYDSSVLPETFVRVESFGSSAASELAMGGRSAMDVIVESRDAATGMVAGTIAITGGSPSSLDLAFHPSFAGATDPELAVLHELFTSLAEVSVFDAAGGGALFTFILP